MLLHALPPGIDFIRLFLKGNMTSTPGAVRWQYSAFSSYVRPKKQHDAWTVPTCRAAPRPPSKYPSVIFRSPRIFSQQATARSMSTILSRSIPERLSVPMDIFAAGARSAKVICESPFGRRPWISGSVARLRYKTATRNCATLSAIKARPTRTVLPGSRYLIPHDSRPELPGGWKNTISWMTGNFEN
jgi:hypothetical protein